MEKEKFTVMFGDDEWDYYFESTDNGTAHFTKILLDAKFGTYEEMNKLKESLSKCFEIKFCVVEIEFEIG